MKKFIDKEADATARGELFKNILLSGGTTMYPGFPTRVKIEMDKFYAKFTKKNPDDELRININVVVSFLVFSILKKGPTTKKVQCVYWRWILFEIT